jgi:hypothetical protein
MNSLFIETQSIANDSFSWNGKSQFYSKPVSFSPPTGFQKCTNFLQVKNLLDNILVYLTIKLTPTNVWIF